MNNKAIRTVLEARSASIIAHQKERLLLVDALNRSLARTRRWRRADHLP
jgi:hypothetical protein